MRREIEECGILFFPPAGESQSHTLVGSSALRRPENGSQLFILRVLDKGKKTKHVGQGYFQTRVGDTGLKTLLFLSEQTNNGFDYFVMFRSFIGTQVHIASFFLYQAK